MWEIEDEPPTHSLTGSSTRERWGRNDVFKCSQALESDFLLHMGFLLGASSLLLLFKGGALRFVMNALATSKWQRTGGL